MKWYDYIILRFQDYKWFLFIPFAVSFAIGTIYYILNITPNWPTITFVLLLVAWAIVWLIASYFHIKNRFNL
jgi:uncharacterized membrane protein